MRPDSIDWKNTQHMSAIEFKPRDLIVTQARRWIRVLLFMQVFWAVAYGAVAVRENAAPLTQIRQTFRKVVDDPMQVFAQTQIATFTLIAAQLLMTAILTVLAARWLMPRLGRQAHSLRELFDAICGLASGAAPKPLPVGHPGEDTYLNLAFNDMASKLQVSRRALIEANQTLEKRVEERTKELREAMEKVQRMAITDALTGLSNRRSLDGPVRDEFEISARTGNELVCLLIDLDGFKAVNDRLGHKTGDELICLAAEVLRSNSRAGDVAIRLGGDEFALVMPTADLAVGEGVAIRLQQQFQARAGEMLKHGNLPKQPSMSIGITSRKFNEAGTLEELLHQADAALYSAKEAGKGRFCTYHRPSGTQQAAA
jgi:diguanylate cyclase (GGDEF)-like protein